MRTKSPPTTSTKNKAFFKSSRVCWHSLPLRTALLEHAFSSLSTSSSIKRRTTNRQLQHLFLYGNANANLGIKKLFQKALQLLQQKNLNVWVIVYLYTSWNFVRYAMYYVSRDERIYVFQIQIRSTDLISKSNHIQIRKLTI